MMYHRLILYILLVGLFTFGSCSKTVDKKEENKNLSTKEVTEKIKNVEVKIEGMTCEIGCARLIQSKLYKTDGIKFAEVSFENKLGKISFDENRISLKEIENKIQNIAGGDLYKVVNSKEVNAFSELN